MINLISEKEKIRLDLYLVEELNFNRSVVKKLIEDECVLVNGKITKASYKIKFNDKIDVNFIEKEEEDFLKPENIPLDVVYEDDDLIIINKQANLVVHPGVGNKNGTLVNGLLYYFKNLSSINTKERPGIVHRIDKDTTGLIMIAKNNQSHEFLANQLKERKIVREYVALVEGVIEVEAGLIDAPIGRDENDRLKMAVTSKNSKHAITEFEVIKYYKEHTLIKCKLQTGRTHQIRVHLAYIGHPLVGDPVYGRKKTIDCEGQALHAMKLGLIHPKTGEYIEFTAGYPHKLQEVIDELERINNNE